MRLAYTFTCCRNYWILFLVFTAFGSSGLLAQDDEQSRAGWTPHHYYGIPAGEKHIAFIDQFEDNRHNWDMKSSMLRAYIKDSDFYCETFSAQSDVRKHAVQLNQNGNYELELRLRYVRGSQKSATGLVFGRDARGNEYTFTFTPEGRYRITRSAEGRVEELLGWQSYRGINKYSYNTLSVRKLDGVWYFFINREYATRMTARQLFGNDFGFLVGGNMAVEVDYLKIEEILSIDATGPAISIVSPVLKDTEPMTLTEQRQTIMGTVVDPSGVQSFTINDRPINLSPQGEFSVTIKELPAGYTRIVLKARDRYNNLSTKDFVLNYQPAPKPAYVERPPVYMPAPAPSQKPAASTPAKTTGKNYLLLIGVNEYESWSKLHNAVRDCGDIMSLLTTEYQFEPENVITLFNDMATRENILETFESLQDRLTANDNLLIYYAGHGYYDEKSELGYWVPVNARLNKVPDFIRNSTIHDYVKTIPSHHTFLIADACYAGSLFARTRGVINEENRSRWAFTSGNIEKVWDGQPGQNSPFARYLLSILRSNKNPNLRADDLIETVAGLVARNTAQTPVGAPLQNVGDDGGVFTFRRK